MKKKLITIDDVKEVLEELIKAKIITYYGEESDGSFSIDCDEWKILPLYFNIDDVNAKFFKNESVKERIVNALFFDADREFEKMNKQIDSLNKKILKHNEKIGKRVKKVSKKR